jgi:DNA-binding transcriptional regulator YiaG
MKSDDDIDKLVQDITVDSYGPDEQLWSFLTAFQDEATLPVEGSVIGEPVTVIKIDYKSSIQQGLLATIRKADGKKYEVGLSHIEFPPQSKAARLQQAYRRWQEFSLPQKTPLAEQRAKIKQTKATVGEIDLTRPVDLVVLGIKNFHDARCRVVGKDKELTLKGGRLWEVVPGEIVRVRPIKHWSFAGHPYRSNIPEFSPAWGKCVSRKVFPHVKTSRYHSILLAVDPRYGTIKMHRNFGCRFWARPKTSGQAETPTQALRPLQKQDVVALLKAKGFSQAELARELGVDRRRVNDWLRCRKVPALAATALRALGLVPSEGSMQPPPKQTP